MGPSLRAARSLLLATLLPMLSLAGPAHAGSAGNSPEPSQPAAPASAPQPGTPPEGQSSTPSLGQALKPSSPEQIALANHLRQRGAIFYGAYWCTHCFRQKNLFGQQAGDRLPYVECAKDQAGADKCTVAEVRAYPTWVLGKERREGVQTLEELAIWSGFAGFGAGKGQAMLPMPNIQTPRATPFRKRHTERPGAQGHQTMKQQTQPHHKPIATPEINRWGASSRRSTAHEGHRQDGARSVIVTT